MDLLVDNMNFTFPINKYAGKDMILHGDEEWIRKGDARRGAMMCQPCESYVKFLMRVSA